MQRLFSSCVEQVSHDSEVSQSREGLKEVLVWVHEHTNLCLTMAGAGSGDSGQVEKLQARLRTSLERGTRLLHDLAEVEGEKLAVSQFSSMVSGASTSMAGSSSVSSGQRRTPAAIPLSGVRRFDEGAAAAQAINFATPMLRPSGSASAQCLAPQGPKGIPLPSRTYIKKSGA